MSRDDEARALVALYDERCRLNHDLATAERPSGAMVDAILSKAAELDAACEEFRRCHFPRRYEVFVGLWSVMVRSKGVRSTVTVLDLFDEYRTEVAA